MSLLTQIVKVQLLTMYYDYKIISLESPNFHDRRLLCYLQRTFLANNKINHFNARFLLFHRFVCFFFIQRRREIENFCFVFVLHFIVIVAKCKYKQSNACERIISKLLHCLITKRKDTPSQENQRIYFLISNPRRAFIYSSTILDTTVFYKFSCITRLCFFSQCFLADN